MGRGGGKGRNDKGGKDELGRGNWGEGEGGKRKMIKEGRMN